METKFIQICDYCKTQFHKTISKINQSKKRKQNHCFCSHKCCKNFYKGKSRNPKNIRITVQCSQCQITIQKRPSELSKVKRAFCSKTCAAKYNNTHKQHGTRRSKLEQAIEIELKQKFPYLDFLFNSTSLINAELDIAIPSLKLAFELNGIVHYEPIYGKDKLSKIQNNDQRKFQACLENHIELCIIDTSSVTYIKPEKVQKFLNIISNIIENKLSSS